MGEDVQVKGGKSRKQYTDKCIGFVPGKHTLLENQLGSVRYTGR